MMDMITGFVDSDMGKMLVAGTLFVTGIGWSGWFPGFTDRLGALGIGMLTVANIMGVVALVGGGILFYSALRPISQDIGIALPAL